MRKYRVVMQKLPLGSEDRDLASRPEPGIDGKDPLLPERRGEEKFPKI